MGSGGAAGRGLIGLIMALAPGAVLACSDDRVEMRWDGGKASFSVEVADSPDERSKGLMFRDKMALSSGMLFVYDSPRRASFWMKNTLIPLDMVFADSAGRVTRVHANAVPGDLTSIDGGEGVQYILEINGGLARRLGIVEGAELRHPVIGADAVWPCGD
jgi:uncharacterized protein